MGINNVSGGSKGRIIKKSVIIGAILCGALLAQGGGGGGAALRGKDLPPIAVYVTGNVSDDDKKTLGTLILASLAKSGRYIAVERSDNFLAAVEEEHIKQRGGDVDDSQISPLGKQSGVKFVCVAEITKAFGSFQMSARIIDVETAAVVYISGVVHGKFKSMGDLARVSDKVVDKMFDKEDSKPRRLHNRVSVAVDYPIVGFSGIDHSKIPEYSGRMKFNILGPRPRIYCDFVYVEMLMSSVSEAGGGLVVWHFPLGKYPIDIGIIKVSPLLGYSTVALGSDWPDTAYVYEAYNVYGAFTLGGRVDIGLSKSAYASAEYLYSFGDFGGNSQSLKINGGLDLGIGKKKRWFWRPELAYRFTRAVFLETLLKDRTYIDENKEISIHDLAVYVGIGYKWRGKKQRL